MSLVAGVCWAARGTSWFLQNHDQEKIPPARARSGVNTGATEDAASRRSSAALRLSRYSAKPSC
jgi:hypothetical protein